MNFYSVLGDSDDEETPKVATTKATANKENKDAKKSTQNAKPAAAPAASASSKANDSKAATKDKGTFFFSICL